jgi:hypothetical protein
MPSIHLSENFGDLLDARFSKIYDKEYAERINESMIPMLFGMKTSTRAYELMSGVGGLGDMQDFDGTIAYDGFSQLYDSTVTFPEKALGIKAERKLVDDELFGILDGRPWQLAVSVARTREKAGAAVFANAFTDASGADGVALCSASHPYSPDDATTQSNSGTSPLSATSVEATRRLGFTSVFNDRGQLMDVNYDLIICPVALEQAGYEIINSKGKVDTNENNANFLEGRFKMAVWPRLTDSNNWFMADSKLMKQFILFWDRIKPEFAYDRDFDTLVAKWSVYARYNTQFTGWQPLYGHNVTG